MVIKINTVFFLVLLLGTFSCNHFDSKEPETSSLITCELNTESLIESKEPVKISCGINSYTLKFNGVISDDVALFGGKSIKLTENFKYGNNIVLNDLIDGEFIKVSIWRKDESKKGSIVVQGKDNEFYKVIRDANESNLKGWDLLEVNFTVPPGLKEVKIYSFIGEAKTSYFDGLKIIRSKSKVYSIHDSVVSTNLYFSPNNLKKFEEKRENAFNLGVNISDGKWIDGILSYNKKAMPMKARLKGDWLDHLIGKKWSFRIKIKDEYTFKRMKVFSLQNPNSRSFLYEYLAHKIFDKADILTTRYGFTNGFVNGSSVGLYSYEEHFVKQLLEYNLRREGPILKFDENPMWVARAYSKDPKISVKMPYFKASRIMPFGAGKIIEDTAKLKQFSIAHKLMNQYKSLGSNVSEIFDVEKLAKYWAMIDLTRGSHGTIWHNQRFYYNPVLCKLEPISFDNYTEYFNPENNVNMRFQIASKPNKATKEFLLNNVAFRDSIFLSYYSKYLAMFSDYRYITEFIKENQDTIDKYIPVIKSEFPRWNYNVDFFISRSKDVNSKLNALDSYIETKQYKNVRDQIKNKDFDFVSDISILPSFVNTYGYKISEELMKLDLENYNSVEIELVGTASNNNKTTYLLNEPKMIKAYLEKPGTESIEIPIVKKMDQIIFKVKNTNKYLYTTITPWQKSTGLSPYQKVKNSFNLSKSNLFKIQGDSLIISAKKHIVSTKVLVPQHKKLIIEAGAEIDIVNKGSFIAHSAVYALGTAEKPILIHSSDSTANGFIVLQANEKSKLNYTTFKNLNTLNYDGWVLTGAVNFYESDVELSNCEFISNQCEDALNIVRSDFKVDKAKFYDIYADAFDSDFCTGELTNSVFDKVDNDAIDFSASQITISDCEISNISDKGISGGEQSALKVYNTNITNCNIGAASKDLSQVELINVSISNCNYGLVALRKKPEYGPAKIYTEGLKMIDCLTDELLELNSVLNREGNIKKGYRKNVAAMFY